LKAQLIAAVIGLCSAAAANAATTVSWIDWDYEVPCDLPAKICSMSGSVTIGGETADVRYTAHLENFAFAQTGVPSDTAFWGAYDTNYGGNPAPVSASPYTSTGPLGNSNAPDNTGIVGLSYAGTHMLEFSRPIAGLYVAVLSLNWNTLSFPDNTLTLLSATGQNIDGDGVDACGFWGCGAPQMTPHSITGAPGQEVSGTFLVNGEFDRLAFTNDRYEYWHGFTIGVAAFAEDTPATVPLPAGAILLATGLGVLVPLRRRALPRKRVRADRPRNGDGDAIDRRHLAA
jgi:hypothetical protein